MDTIVVIGGGAAGMIAAATAAEKGRKTILIEKNEKLGKKIYITGKGRCNITNAQDLDDFMDNITTNKNFLYSALYTFTNQDIVDLMHKYGVETKIERGNRVFPVSDKSNDVIKALSKHLKENNVDIKLNTAVKKIIVQEDKVKGVLLHDGSIIDCSKVIIATGGISYPSTGSTGDGYEFAKEAGHTIKKLSAGLVPLEIEEDWPKKLQGLALKNIEMKITFKNKEIYSGFGELLFTHFGISGPLVLTASNHINNYLEKGKVHIGLNLKPALTQEVLDKRLQRDFVKYANKQFKNALNELLPSKLIPIIISLSNIPEDKLVNQITKEERMKILDLLTNLPMTSLRTRSINEAIVTIGGVDIKKINPSTMESKIINGMYFAGEVMDIDALTGGYNLQLAFSTGYLAGINV
ncbi:NAD(P)/FAD-dependent oxidoreductase [Lutibacter sp. B2]|nr:NAD(P)/FAD-dependent oxidoreductase [Lutibacter sp. B2]